MENDKLKKIQYLTTIDGDILMDRQSILDYLNQVESILSQVRKTNKFATDFRNGNLEEYYQIEDNLKLRYGNRKLDIDEVYEWLEENFSPENKKELNQYIYIPNTYNLDFIKDKFLDENEFVELQVLYRKNFEKKLVEQLDFAKIDEYIKNSGVDIPIIDDNEYNFYHKYSTLGSNYVFVRNNIHIENLSKEELEQLKSKKIDENFFITTFKKVMFEEGNGAFFGMPMDDTLVNPQSIVFEFAYDQKKCSNLQQLQQIEKIIKNVFTYLNESLLTENNIPKSYCIYNSIPDLYFQEEKTNTFQ